MIKRVLSLILAVTMLFSLSGCSDLIIGGTLILFLAVDDDRADKEEVFEFVRENEEELRKAVADNDYSAFENQGFVNDVSADDAVVDFSCGGAGMGSGTSYVGFYYTAEDDMTAIWCAPPDGETLIPSGDGFEWQEEDGDNRYYTEKICECFYYYEASF